MKFLADECIPAPIVHRLREDGFDVEYVLEDEPGTEDSDVLRRAGQDNRFLLTEDRDFGQLVYNQNQPASPGVIYLRLGDVGLAESIEALVAVLSSDLVFEGTFTAVDGRRRVRQRLLPPH